MEKGKFGIRMAFYAVLAFILVIFGYSTALFLLAGVVMFVEKDEWASRQVIQAICLLLTSAAISVFFGLFSFVYAIPIIGSIWGTLVSVVESLVDIAILVFVIIALVKVAKGKEAGVPLADKFAYWAYGKVVAKPQPVAQPMQQPMQQAPVQQPVAQPMQQPVANAGVCSNCGTPLNGAAFCTKCGTPAAK